MNVEDLGLKSLIEQPDTQHDNRMTIDVILITHLKRPDYFRQTLLSLSRMRRQSFFLRFSFGLTNESELSKNLFYSIIHEVDPRQHFEKAIPLNVQVLSSKLFPGGARNQLIQQLDSQWLFFVDDDVTVATDLLSELSLLLNQHPNASVFGGPNLTPKGSSFFQKISGDFFSNPIVCGPFAKRYSPKGLATQGNESNLILCGLFVKTEAFLQSRFPDDYVCAEENHLIVALQKLHFQMIWSPQLLFFHQRRDDLRGLCQQLYKYGRGRAQLFTSFPRQTLATSIWPILLTALPLLVANFQPRATLLLIAIHTALGAFYSVLQTRSVARSFAAALLTWIAIPAYIIGFWHGSYQQLKMIKKRRSLWPRLFARKLSSFETRS